MKLKLSNLSFRYHKNDKQIFDNLNYTFESGKIYLLNGNNGTGKTTLLNIIAGNLNPNAGCIEYPGGYNTVNISVKKMLGSSISNVSNLVYEFTVEQYFTFLSKAYRCDNQNIINLTDLLQINYLNKSIKSLSSGMRKKVEIAGALLHKPDILLLDEPFAFLDFSAQENLIQLMTEYITTNDKIIIFSSHEVKYVPLNPIIFDLNSQ